jgi:hypothetical protein
MNSAAERMVKVASLDTEKEVRHDDVRRRRGNRHYRRLIEVIADANAL